MYTDLAHILSDYFVIVARDLLILAITLVLLTYAARSKQQGVVPQPQSLPVTGTDEAQNNTAM
jgi:hypothetical protein